MNWRPHTEQPFEDAPVFTALLARKDDDGEFFLLLSIHFWKNGKWIEESTGRDLDTDRPFWWIPESEVLESLDDEWGLKGDKHEIERSKS